jgi:hypothetical protein
MARRLKASADWTRPLPRPLDFAGVLTVRTISDVRVLVERHLPESHRDRPHWHAVSVAIAEAAIGGDVQEVEIALWLAAAIEGLRCRPTNKRASRRQTLKRGRGTRSQGGTK